MSFKCQKYFKTKESHQKRGYCPPFSWLYDTLVMYPSLLCVIPMIFIYKALVKTCELFVAPSVDMNRYRRLVALGSFENGME